MLVAFRRLLHPRYEVVGCVSTGDAAVEAARTLQPDVMVVDLMMPQMDGLEVCRRVKAAEPAIEIVIVTAFDDAQMQNIAVQVGAAAFVPKRSAATTLERTIDRILSNRKDIQEDGA